MADSFADRTEHALKNRFFSLLSFFSNMPIRQIKKEKIHLSTFIVYDAYERLKILFLNNSKINVDNQILYRIDSADENDISFSIVDSAGDFNNNQSGDQILPGNYMF